MSKVCELPALTAGAENAGLRMITYTHPSQSLCTRYMGLWVKEGHVNFFWLSSSPRSLVWGVGHQGPATDQELTSVQGGH